MNSLIMKKKNIWLAALLCFFCIFAFGCGSTVQKSDEKVLYSVVDSKGTTVDFSAKPQRILTLSMATDQIVLGMVTTDKLVAVNALLDDPTTSNIAPLGRKVERKITNPSAEEIFSLRPDVVIVPDWGAIDQVDILREMGLKVVVVEGAKSITEVKDSIQIIATALGEPEKGNELLSLMDQELADVEKKVALIPQDERKRMLLISVMTSYGGIGSSFDDACKYAGVINGAAAEGLHTGQPLTKEMIVKINPDILLLPAYNNHGSFDVKAFNDGYLLDPSLQTIKAIQQKAIMYPREDYIYNNSQDIVFAVREIARCAYGEVFAFPDNVHLSVSGEKNE